MKTAIILILMLILTGVSFLTRPSEKSFRDVVKQRIESEHSSILGKLMSGTAADLYMKQVNFQDHYLWTTVEKDGQTIYVGAFSHWFPLEEAKQVFDQVRAKVEQEVK